jgi:uncharacterized membrane protein
VVGDLALSTAAPPGHGHTYGMLQGAAAWAGVAAPGFQKTCQKTPELHRKIARIGAHGVSR